MIEKRSPINIQAIYNDNLGGEKPDFLTEDKVSLAKKFHSSFSEYKSTPLIKLNGLASRLGVKNVYVKDEAYRFNLDAFKVLGGAFAIAQLLADKLEKNITDINFNYLKKDEVKKKLGTMTFVSATDGNHGRGVAWAASQLGHKAIIYLPRGSAQKRVEAIEEAGGKAIVTDLNYDDTVHIALDKAKENNWYIVQDTAWEGYEKIPTWIMQGYTTMAQEVLSQLELEGEEVPTHVFLQAGVGSMAGAVLGYYVNIFDKYPITAIIEPEEAACVFKSASIGDGNPHSFGGDLRTDMAGLACGEPNPISWKILRDFAHMYISCPDYVSARGIRILANPTSGDQKIIAGESGAVGIGLLSLLMERNELGDLKKGLQLDEDSTILIFNTEGATDPVNYEKIVWDGKDNLPF